MFWKPLSASSRPGSVAGFTLVELLVALAMGLVATLAITHAVFHAEAQKRAATSGSDAQANGATAMSQLRRALLSAGYGYTQTPEAIGCEIVARHGGAAVPGFPTVLAPVLIVDGPSGAPDEIRVLSSSKKSYSVPLRLTSAFKPMDTQLSVASTVGVQADTPTMSGDLLLAAKDSVSPCHLFQVTGIPALGKVERLDDEAGWNPSGHPAGTYGEGKYLINLGSVSDQTFAIRQEALAVTTFRLAADSQPTYIGPNELQPNIVSLQALYGKDANGDGLVDGWDAVTPSTGADWLAVAAIRIAVVARSPQFEKDVVTDGNLQWDVGNVTPVTGAVACGPSACLAIRLDHLTDWQHYRYKMFESIVPLRNMLWKPA